MSRKPEFGGLVLERARKKAGMDRLDLFLAYEELCARFGIEPRSQYTYTKWMQGRNDLQSVDFNLLASVINRDLPAPDRLRLAGVPGWTL